MLLSMTESRWRTSNTSVYNIGYHLIWCPKYRKKVLVGDIEKRFKELLFKKAKEINVSIENIEIMPDHVHLFVKTKPNLAPQFVVAQFKGYTSHELRSEFSTLRTRLPTLWTRSYYCESVGHISEKTVKKYIEEQKTR